MFPNDEYSRVFRKNVVCKNIFRGELDITSKHTSWNFLCKKMNKQHSILHLSYEVLKRHI